MCWLSKNYRARDGLGINWNIYRLYTVDLYRLTKTVLKIIRLEFHSNTCRMWHSALVRTLCSRPFVLVFPKNSIERHIPGG